jgi:tetratricopeptide (TPR) repeat protein
MLFALSPFFVYQALAVGFSAFSWTPPQIKIFCPNHHRKMRKKSWLLPQKKAVVLTLLLILFSSESIFSQTSQLFIQQGDKAYQRFDNLNALLHYEKAYRLKPEKFEYLIRMIRAGNDIGEDLHSKESERYFEQAVRYAEQMLKRYPKRAETYYWLAVSYGNLALLKGGKEKVKLSGHVQRNAQKAIDINPMYADAYAVLGVYYKEVASLNGFLKVFARVFLGELPDGTYQDAIKNFQRAIKLQTTNPVYVYSQLARTYELMGASEKAERYYQNALRLPSIVHQDDAIKKEIRTRLLRL